MLQEIETRKDHFLRFSIILVIVIILIIVGRGTSAAKYAPQKSYHLSISANL
jgi:hypothetical protein